MFRILCLWTCAGALATAVPALAQPTLAPGSASDGNHANSAGAATPQDEAAAAEEAERQRLTAAAEEWQQKAAEYRNAWEEAPARLKEIEREIVRLSDRDGIEVAGTLSVSELEAELVVAEQHLNEAQEDAAALDAEAAHRIERRKRIPELLADARTRLRPLTEATSPPEGAPADTASRVDRLRNERIAALEAELEAYRNELASYDARGALLSKRRDRAALSIAYYGALVSKLREAHKERQRRELAAQNEEARRLLEQIDGLPEEVRALAYGVSDQNAALAELWVGDDGLVQKLDTVTSRLERARAAVTQVQSDLSALSAKVEAVGLEDTVGALLRRQRAEVPDVGMYRRFVRMRREQIGAAQLQQLKLRERRDQLSDLDGLVQARLESLPEPLTREQAREAERVLRGLYDHQRQYMDALVVDYETYFQRLVDFDAEQRTLIDRSEELIDFIDRHVLWMPSAEPVGDRTLGDAGLALRWLLSPHLWQQVATAGRALLADQTAAMAALSCVLIAMAAMRRRLRRRLIALAKHDGSDDVWSARATFQVLILTAVLSLWLPSLIGVLGLLLLRSPDATAFTRSIAYGLCTASVFAATLRFAASALIDRGLAQTHAGWHGPSLAQVRRHLSWLSAVTVPAVFVVFTLERRGDDGARESLGRLAFLVAAFAIATGMHLLLRPGGAWAEILRRRHGRTRRGWALGAVHVGGTLGPVVLGIAAASGYFWTALQLAIREHLTVCLLFALVLVVDTVRLLTRRAERRLAIERAQRAAAQAAEAAAALDGRPSTEGSMVPVVDEVDLAVVSRQTGHLTFMVAALVGLLGASAIWADLLPAAGILKQVQLWHVTQTVTTANVDASGAQHAVEQHKLIAITLSDLLTSLLIATLSFLLLRNVPGLFEVTLFRRLQAGERYAYATIVKYAIATTGAALAFDAIGIGWSSIQWLIAAVGLGLGFGLQEIFANFVSGIIILLERPIRVGDIVTVGKVSGTVTRIRTRATWITAFDRTELVVPNKEFVTSRLVNWSLSDGVIRADLPVGIAYGSDVQKALATLQRVADENPLVLKDPPAQVLFRSFGDSALGLELRAFVGQPGARLTLLHELHLAVDRAFREAGIEIAFPQTDIHLRSVPAGMFSDGNGREAERVANRETTSPTSPATAEPAPMQARPPR